MDKSILIQIIRNNKLIYLSLDSLCKKLSAIIGDAPSDIKNLILELIEDGTLFLDDNKKVSISADRGLFKAKLILNKKGYGFAQVEGCPDFFIPAFAINGAFDNDDSKQINQVTQAILRDNMIPLPPFAEQERIVSTLDEAFALVDFVNEETENIDSG